MMEGHFHHIGALSERETPLLPPLLLEVRGKTARCMRGGS